MSAPTASSRTLKVVVAVAVLAAIGVGAYYAMRPTATVVTVQRGLAADVVTGSVVVHADKDLQEIRSELPGRVVWVDPRQLGEQFKAGEPIVKLDSTDLEREMKQAEVDYNAVVERLKLQKQNDQTLVVAKNTLATVERAYARKEISEEDMNAARRAYDRVQTELALADFDAKQAKAKFDKGQADRRLLLEKMTIRAPMDGVCQSVKVAQGALIAPQTVVATFFSNERVVIAKVGEEDIGRVKVGQPAKVHLLRLARSFDAEVTTILPFAEAETQRYSIYLKVNAELKELEPFATGEVAITVGQRTNQPLIPRRALLNDRYVFVVKNGRVEKREVSVGFRALNLAEITGRLEPGEVVIVDDIDRFRDGEHVRAKLSQ